MIFRKGMSLIELIIAIIVMGISIMSLPLILTTTQSNNQYSLILDNMISKATALLQVINTYSWDEKTVSSNDSETAFILKVDNGDVAFNPFPDNNSSLRKGHQISNKNRRKFSNDTASTILGLDTNDSSGENDIDDFHNVIRTFKAHTGVVDHQININSTIQVQYFTDTTNYNGSSLSFDLDPTHISNQSTNIKMVTITSSPTDPTILPRVTFRLFRANIGGTVWNNRTSF